MAQNLEFGAQPSLTLTATAFAVGSYTGGTAADSVTYKAGTCRYVAAFSTNLAAGAWRLDYSQSGTVLGDEVFDVDGAGTYQPRSESAAAVSIATSTTIVESE